MKLRVIAVGMMCAACFTGLSGAALAHDAGPPPAYIDARPDKAVLEQIDNLILWAESELAEHDGEGLYKGHAEEKTLVLSMIERARALRSTGDEAARAGRKTEALSYYFAAEATARYAAQMPHLLEDRLEADADHDHDHDHDHAH